MKKAAARRVPRKVGADEDDQEPSSASSGADQSPGSVIRKANAKPRKSSALRKSFGPTSVDDEEESATVVTPKRSNISRISIQRNVSKRPSLLASQLPTRSRDEDEDENERPSYTAASLQRLKDSTPSTPQKFESPPKSGLESDISGTQALDLGSKFGSSLSLYEQGSVIPSAAEIAEKKARRARLAKEQEAEEYVSLDPDDPDLDEDDNVMKDEHGRLILKPKDKYGHSESRLVRDDEDIMENFDDFTEDGKISLGRKAEAEAERKRKQDMAAQIAEAEGRAESESDDSERERNDAFEAAQTRHGTYSQSTASANPLDRRPKTPPIITPIPTLDAVIERVRKRVADMQSSRMQKLQEMEHLQREKIRLAEEEVRIQRALKETANKFEELKKEKGIGAADQDNAPAIEAPLELDMNGLNQNADMPMSEEPKDAHAEHEDKVDDDEEDEERLAFGGLGFAGARRGLGTGLEFGASPAEGCDGD